jgi:hypothetical protein
MGQEEIKTIKGFWNLFDSQYYNALAKSSVEFAIEDIKSINREDRGFLQEMRKRQMDKNNMGHHITRDDMVKKHWVPLLTEQAREAWDSVENYKVMRLPPLWPQLETLLEEEGERAQPRGDRRPREKNMDKLNSCNTCDKEHPKGKHTRSKIEKTKRII